MATATVIRLRPLASWVLVRPEAVLSETTKAGLVKVDFSTEKPQTGVVLAVGPDVASIVEPGDVVLYGKFVGTEVTLGDGDALVLDVKDLLAVVDIADEPTPGDG